jgi:hypothetical protein
MFRDFRSRPSDQALAALGTARRHITHDVRSRSAQDQCGPERALGEAEGNGSCGQTEANDVRGSAEEDSGGAESKVDEGEARLTRAINRGWRRG